MFSKNISKVIQGQEIINRKRYEIDQLISMVNGFLKHKNYTPKPLLGGMNVAEVDTFNFIQLGSFNGKIVLLKTFSKPPGKTESEIADAQTIPLTVLEDVHRRLEYALEYLLREKEYKDLLVFLKIFTDQVMEN